MPTVRVNFVKQKENAKELQAFREQWNKAGVDSIGVQNFCDWNSAETDEKYIDVKFKCSLPFHMMVIRYNGDVLPCCNFVSSEFVVGNIYSSTISQIWNSDQVSNLRKIHSTDHGWRENPICKKCVKGFVNSQESK